MTSGVGEDGSGVAGASPADVPPETGNGPTQLLPMVRRDRDGVPAPAVNNAQAVRAVARRVASALPALGRDGAPEVPRSARITADRRRRAKTIRGTAAGPGPAGDAAGPDDAPLDNDLLDNDRLGDDRLGDDLLDDGALDDGGGALEDGARQGSLDDEALEGAALEGAALEGAASEDEPAAARAPFVPRQRSGSSSGTVTVGATAGPAAEADRMAVAAALNAPTTETPVVPTPVVPTPVVPTPVVPTPVVPTPVVATPVVPTSVEPSSVEPSSATPPARRAPVTGPAGVVDAEVIEDSSHDLVITGSGRPVVAAAVAAELVSALTEDAFREARSDEWIMAEPVPLSTALAPVLVGAGPRVLDADSWDTSIQPLVHDQDYQGRRRARAGSVRLWVVLALVVAAVTTAVAVPLVLTSGSGPGSTGGPPGRGLPVAIDGNEDISGTSSPGPSANGNATGVAPVAGASPGVTTSAEDPGTAGPTPAGSATTSPAAIVGFVPVTIEAEAGGSATSWGGTATRSTMSGASGGAVIDHLGEHWSGSTTDGFLDFRNITVTDGGSYRVTISYVNLAPGSDNPRRLTITTNGSGGQSHSFGATSTVATQAITVTLQGGIANTIRFTENDVQSPAIDKIVISKV